MADESGTTSHAIFDRLAKKGEPELRRILRSHRDVPFRGDDIYDDEALELRRDLDLALDELMVLELELETGVRSQAPPLSASLKTLFESNAFARFVNSYLYFGVRLLVGRLLGERSYSEPPRRNVASSTSATDEIHEDLTESFDMNDLPLALPCPPSVGSDARIEQGIASRRTLFDDRDVIEALGFLDDFVPDSLNAIESNSPIQQPVQPRQTAEEKQAGECGWQADFERWLRGLGTYTTERDAYFRRVAEGLRKFIRWQVDFYVGLEGPKEIDAWRECGRLTDVMAKNPRTARFGLLDLYWLARLLRADVSSVGIVTYTSTPFTELLAARAPLDGLASKEMDEATPVLRAVFDFTCDLIQNAVAIACDQLDRSQNRDSFPNWPDETVTWRRAYDEELAEVAEQRKKRGFHFTKAAFALDHVAPKSKKSRKPVDWSHRIRTGQHLEHLIGLAFSGGGIRSATFNLGVLQRLQELDLLRSVDYLSTVSGGGYIGSWLLGNVRRTHYWLSQLTDWGPSIDHLRRFSNYLAPRSGLMSVDTWAMWMSWVRNAFLIQLTAFVWLAVVLVVARLVKSLFTLGWFHSLAGPPGNFWLAPLLVILTAMICFNIRTQKHSVKEWHVLAFAVAPAWAGSFMTAAALWAADRPVDPQPYSALLTMMVGPWFWPLLFLFVALWLLSACSIDPKHTKWTWLPFAFGFIPAGAAVIVVYLGFCGISYLFGYWGAPLDRFGWFAYVVGAPLVLFAMTLSVVFVIGLIGHDSEDWRREWWTRFGSWLGISGVAFLLVSVVSVFGPLLLLGLFDQAWGAPQWSTILGWIATVIGGLLSGSSEKTVGNSGKTPTTAALEWLSKIAALAFIAGAVLIGSTIVHVLLVKIFTAEPVSYNAFWLHMGAIRTIDYWIALAVFAALGAVFSFRFEINIFGLNQFYRNRLVRCYLGATRWQPGLRKPHKFTGFDRDDDLPMTHFRHDVAGYGQHYRGPFPLVNGSLNLGGSSDLSLHTRHSASFVFTPLRAGADRKAVGYAPMYSRPRHPADGPKRFAGGVFLGQAISVSGAAASPNMGYSTSPMVAFLLTIFNVRLGWWFPNPGRRFWHHRWLPFSMWYLVREMFGLADEDNMFVNVSDGGHFENLAIYELVRRRCKVIIACDGECDPDLTFGSLGNVIRLCEIDFNAKIDIDVESIRKQKDSGFSRAHCAVGTITYSNGSRGYLIYLKSSLTGDEDASIEQYHANHDEFPHEPTSDQFFAEDQFESYRRLGYHIAKLVFRDVEHEPSLVEMARNLTDLWAPSSDGDSFIDQAKVLDEIWDRFRSTGSLHPLLNELMADAPAPWPRLVVPPPNPAPLPPARLEGEELAMCLQLIQLMENVFIALQLDDFWTHPDNRGWVALFTSWSKCGTFRQAWKQTRQTFGIGFVYFCEHRLGLADRN